MAPPRGQVCRACGGELEPTEPHWAVGYHDGGPMGLAHTACVDWASREPPYLHLLPELAKLRRRRPTDLAVIAAIQAIERMRWTWPRDAVASVREVLEFVHEARPASGRDASAEFDVPGAGR